MSRGGTLRSIKALRTSCMNGTGRPGGTSIVGQAYLRDIHPAGEDSLHGQPAVGILLVPDVDGGVGQSGGVVEDLAAESDGLRLYWRGCRVLSGIRTCTVMY